MGWQNPPVPWSEIERRLSDNTYPRAGPPPDSWGYSSPAAAAPAAFPGADGGDSPAWSRKRGAYQAPELVRPTGPVVPYAELHCHSNFSFLDGASHPEELAEEATRLGLTALAITDHDGFYGVVRFAEAAREVGLKTVFGAELSLGVTVPQNGEADPAGHHLVVLARDPTGYARLSRLMSEAQMSGEKGAPHCSLDGIAMAIENGARDHWLVLTGCRKGTVPWALEHKGPAAARRELTTLIDIAGRDNVVIELWDHGDPLDGVRNDGLAHLAC